MAQLSRRTPHAHIGGGDMAPFILKLRTRRSLLYPRTGINVRVGGPHDLSASFAEINSPLLGSILVYPVTASLRTLGWMDGYIDGWMDGWVGGWVGGWMDGWMDGPCQKYVGLLQYIIISPCDSAEVQLV